MLLPVEEPAGHPADQRPLRQRQLLHGLRTRTLGIYEKDTGRSIVCDVAGFPYTLIWSALSKPVRFVCIEPWNSLPASVDDPQEWEQRAAAACLAPGGEWSTTLSTTFNR